MNAAAIATLFSIVNKVLDKLPDYDQKKRREWFELKEAYEKERKKTYATRDDDRVMNLRDELLNFAVAFDKELK